VRAHGGQVRINVNRRARCFDVVLSFARELPPNPSDHT